MLFCFIMLTHRGQVTHICVSKLVIIDSDNGLSPDQPQVIIRTDAGILLIGPLGTNFSEIVIEIHTFSFMKMHLQMWSGKWRKFCLGLNVLNRCCQFWAHLSWLFHQNGGNHNTALAPLKWPWRIWVNEQIPQYHNHSEAERIKTVCIFKEMSCLCCCSTTKSPENTSK